MSGKTYNDRIQSSRVRTKVLNVIERVMDGKDKSITPRQWEMALRMATTVLPRLNEHTGTDGAPMVIQFDEAFKK